MQGLAFSNEVFPQTGLHWHWQSYWPFCVEE